jgi:membrane protein
VTVRARLESLGQDALRLARDCFGRAVEIEFVDRSVAIASLTFTAMIPLGVVADSVVPSVDRSTLTDWIVRKFRLTGDSADLIRSVFAPPEDVRRAVSWLGVVLVIVAALSFTRALQRVYERSWRLESLGVRGTPAGLAWLLGVVIFLSIFTGIRSTLVDWAGPVLGIGVAIGFSTLLWLLTPFILLSRRIPWRALVPSAALAAVAMTALSVASVIYMPTAIADSAARYGQIGVAIALVSWLVAVGFVLVISAAVGAVLAERLGLTPQTTKPTGPADD